MNFRTIGIVGAGTMGRGIAQVCIQRGFDVALNDVDAKALEKAAAAIEKQLARAVEKGRISAEDQAAAMSRLRLAPSLEDLAEVDLCIEAATENPDLKLDLFRALEGVCSKEAIIASNTSSISLTRIAGVCTLPERVIGMHFFNPVPVMELVELIRALQTSDATFDAVSAFSERLGKSVVSVKDSPGFVVNRMLVPLINEAVFVLAEGLAEAEEIDKAMRLGANHPIGPLALADLVGLDVCLYVLDVLYREFSDSKYRACPLLRKMVDAGRLGRKSGRGFFEYA
ncbi:3-hydroxybutyryl-CoA dehydrogenase [Thioalkalivibrio sp. HK1]|uniref:3-hydroxybutyryl-CoA dehydrogenase n=1 Tax=Thioalkalivibrio sp. HK1 TaxID=1469245 RepID=UPI000472E289|nr:3-hydroxybutyryl-CoA dehydrogenase [Thioalkalivibrio sp. HK1]